MDPVVYGLSSGTAPLPSSGLTMGAASSSATASSSSQAPIRPAAGQDRHLPALVQHAGRLPEIVVGGQPRAAGPCIRGVMRDIPLRPALVGGHLLDVDRNRDVAHPAIGQRGATGEVHHVLHVRGVHDARVVLAHVDVEPVQLDVLLLVGVDEVGIGQTGDGDHRLAVQLGVVETVQEVDAPGAGGGQTHPEPPGELGVGARHERGGLLVANVDEPHLLAALPECLHHAVDAIPGQAKHHLDAPLVELIDQNVRRRLRHGSPPLPPWSSKACAGRAASRESRSRRVACREWVHPARCP